MRNVSLAAFSKKNWALPEVSHSSAIQDAAGAVRRRLCRLPKTSPYSS